VAVLLAAYGVADLFDPALVLDKEAGVTKVAHHEHLARATGVAWPEMTFVDDKVNHLDAVAALGVRCALAAWGYNGTRERRLARAHGHLVCTLDDVEPQLFGATRGGARTAASSPGGSRTTGVDSAGRMAESTGLAESPQGTDEAGEAGS
jgi:hypothetical protein